MVLPEQVHHFLGEERRSWRTIVAAGLAVLAHAGLFAWSMCSHGRPGRDLALEIAPATLDVDFDRALPEVEPDTPQSAAAIATERPLSRGATPLPADTPRVSASANGGATSAPALASSAEAATGPTMPGTPLTIVAPAPVTGIIGGPNPFLPTGPAAPEAPMDPSRTARPEAKTAAEAKRAVEQSMKAGALAQDTALGLGPEGPVVRALVDATYGSLAPERGNAVFLAVVDASGTVTDLRLVSSSGDQQGWGDARAQAIRGLVGKKILLRGAKGVELRIAITSDMRLPSGSAPGSTLGSALTGSFDVTDMGGKARRVVHARLVSSTML